MQDTFAHATHSAGQAQRATIGCMQDTFARARATIGYLVYKTIGYLVCKR